MIYLAMSRLMLRRLARQAPDGVPSPQRQGLRGLARAFYTASKIESYDLERMQISSELVANSPKQSLRAATLHTNFPTPVQCDGKA
jgi:hypothetical protein